MAQIWQKLRNSKLFLWLCLGAVGLGLVIPLLLLIPNRNQSRLPESMEEHQAIVSEVISSMDRNALIGTSPTKGNASAQIVLFEFSDFECPYCAIAAGSMNDFVDRHESDVLFVYKHFPLTQIHAEAMPAAKASWAANQQGQFWLYHDGLFANQDRLGEDLYVELAAAIGLDMEQFNRDRNSPEAEAAIQADLALAEKLQLSGTPTFILNDLLIPVGLPPEAFETLFNQINDAIKTKPQS